MASIAPPSFYKDFTPVNRKKRKNRGPKDREPILAAVHRLHDDLAQNDWLPQCQQIIRDSLEGAALAQTPLEVLCLGLGSPTASANARAQLAFLLAICDDLNIDHAKVSLYDPVFTAEDVTLFRELQLQLLTENKGAAYALNQPTLCFMPHCDLELYERLLHTNAADSDRGSESTPATPPKSTLHNMLLVANRLADYTDRCNPRHKLAIQAPSLLALAPTLECRPFPASRPWPTAFNNTAVQFLIPGASTGITVPVPVPIPVGEGGSGRP